MANYSYLIRRKVLTLFGAKFHVYDANDTLIGFSRQKAFKLKEDIRVYTDETESAELLHIQARQIIDFSACYDVIDVKTQTSLGTWRRGGFRSLLRDTWELLDINGDVIATLKEDSWALALLRRLICNLIPQRYNLMVGEVKQATYVQRFNPFIFKLEVAMLPSCKISPKLICAGGILLSAIEGRQQ